MGNLATVIVVLIFAVLSLVHFYWALGGGSGKVAAVPESSGRPAFVPSAGATAAVAFALALCALLVAATAGLVRLPIPGNWLRWLSYVLSVVLLARAIGDFRLVGFFKRVRGTRFARLDSIVYAPLCLFLAAGVYYVANIHGA